MTKYTVILKVTKPDDSDAGDLYLYHVDAEDADLAEKRAWNSYKEDHEVTDDQEDEYTYVAAFMFFGHQEDLLS
jgi:hypothetical protein